MKRVIRANDGRLKIIYQSSRNRVQIRDQGYTYRSQPVTEWTGRGSLLGTIQ